MSGKSAERDGKAYEAVEPLSDTVRRWFDTIEQIRRLERERDELVHQAELAKQRAEVLVGR